MNACMLLLMDVLPGEDAGITKMISDEAVAHANSLSGQRERGEGEGAEGEGRRAGGRVGRLGIRLMGSSSE